MVARTDIVTSDLHLASIPVDQASYVAQLHPTYNGSCLFMFVPSLFHAFQNDLHVRPVLGVGKPFRSTTSQFPPKVHFSALLGVGSEPENRKLRRLLCDVQGQARTTATE